MRVNMDSSILSDPRFKMVARQVGVSLREVIGSCFMLWLHCYESRTERLTLAQANGAAEIDGFAESLVSVGLADARDGGALTIHGVKDRIKFLQSQKTLGKKGGRASAKARKDKELASNIFVQANGQPKAQANVKRSPSECQASSLTLTPALTPALTLSPNTKEELPAEPAVPSRKKKTDAPVKDPTAHQERFGAVAEITGMDGTIQANAKRIGKIAAELGGANPPYTPKEILELGDRWLEFVPWPEVEKVPLGKILDNIKKVRETERMRETTFYETAHGMYDPVTDRPDKIKRRMCRYIDCEDCKPKRGQPGDPILSATPEQVKHRLDWNPDGTDVMR